MRAEECDETIEELADEAQQVLNALGSVQHPLRSCGGTTSMTSSPRFRNRVAGAYTG